MKKSTLFLIVVAAAIALYFIFKPQLPFASGNVIVPSNSIGANGLTPSYGSTNGVQAGQIASASGGLLGGFASLFKPATSPAPAPAAVNYGPSDAQLALASSNAPLSASDILAYESGDYGDISTPSQAFGATPTTPPDPNTADYYGSEGPIS